MAKPLNRAQLTELRDHTAATLAAIDSADMTASASMRARYEGAHVALTAALGDADALKALLGDTADTTQAHDRRGPGFFGGAQGAPFLSLYHFSPSE